MGDCEVYEVIKNCFYFDVILMWFIIVWDDNKFLKMVGYIKIKSVKINVIRKLGLIDEVWIVLGILKFGFYLI